MCFLPRKKNALKEKKKKTNLSQTPFLNIRIPAYTPTDGFLSQKETQTKSFFYPILCS